MKVWVRRSLLGLALMLALAALLSGVGVTMFCSAPAWYAPQNAAPAAQRQQWAQAAENKLIDAQNWAVDLRGDAVRAARAQQNGGATPSTRAAGSFVVEFSQEEINALFEKWSVLYGWGEKYREFVEEPEIVLRDGRLILAGKVRSFGAVVSVQFHPSMDDVGQLRLELAEVAGGRLPLPDAMWRSYRSSIESALRRRMAGWKAQAKIDASGAANAAAMDATMSQLFFHVMRNEPADPVLFLPLAEGGDSVPVKLRGVQVDEGKLSLAVVPMSGDERAALLRKIRSGT